MTRNRSHILLALLLICALFFGHSGAAQTPTAIPPDGVGQGRSGSVVDPWVFKPLDSYGQQTGTQQNPLVTMPPQNQLVPQRKGMPQPPTPTQLINRFGNPIGTQGDALKVFDTSKTDPCLVQKGTDVAISQTATTRYVNGKPGLAIYICFIRIVVGAAEITSELAGTGTNCGTGQIALSGSTTAANGESFAANGGYVAGDSTATVIGPLPPGYDFCVGQSGSNRVSGKLRYVYAIL